MPDANDMDLVREFARDNSEAAFTELVRRHINLVYSVARRHTGNDGDAQDVTQAVFIILARKAAGLRERTVLSGWLYETTRFTAAGLLCASARRHAREQEAYMQSTLNEADTAAAWEKLSPHLETAMSKLAERDRALLVLRFYENKTGLEAAALLGIREDAAHKRVTRAIEKLRKIFAQQGVTLSGAALSGAVSTNSVQAAPAALVKTISAAAVAKNAATTAATLTLVKGTLKAMTWLKFRFAVIGASGLIAITAIIVTVLNHHGHEDARPRAASLSEIQQLFALATAARPQRSQFEADIELTTPPYTKAQVETELAHIKSLMQDVNRRMNPQQELDWEIVQSKAIVKANSGKRIQHVREWYSGNYYRIDVNDEAMGTEKFMQTHPNEYRDTFVNIPNSPFSPYASYQVNRELRDIDLFKQERFGQENQLWQALQMDQQLAMMFVVSLMDSSYARKNSSPHALDFSKMKLDSTKAQRLHDQTDSMWRLEAFDEKLNGKNVTRFSLKPTPSYKGLFDAFHADVWIGQVSGKTVCLQESHTNFPPRTSVISKREKFGDDGFPSVWTISKVNANSSFETKRVVFKRMELNPTFTDEEAFAPVFPPNYIVSDLSSGRGVILQNPGPEMWLKNSPTK